MSPLYGAELYRYCHPSHSFSLDSLPQPLPLIFMGATFSQSKLESNSIDIFVVWMAIPPLFLILIYCYISLNMKQNPLTAHNLYVPFQKASYLGRPNRRRDQSPTPSQRMQTISQSAKLRALSEGKISALTCRLSASHFCARHNWHSPMCHP